MEQERLYKETAELLDLSVEFVREFCGGGDEEALKEVTPDELAQQMIEYFDNDFLGVEN